jgi:hypothetical protein
MLPVYNLTDDFAGQDGVLNTSPYWIAIVYRYENEVTFNKLAQKSFTDNAAAGLRISKRIVIDNDCIAVSTRTDKGQPISQASMTLLPGTNYLNEIFPGDWMAIWIVNSKQKYLSLKQRLNENKACNDFDDGLKFLGKVQTVNMSLSVDADGSRTQRFNVSGLGFQEFLGSIFYDPILAQAVPSLGEYLAKMEILVENFLKEGQITTDLAIPQIVNTLLGVGVPSSSFRPVEGIQIGTGLTQGTGTVPYAFAVPVEISDLLGIFAGNRDGVAYASILQRVFGVQRYPTKGDAKYQPLIPALRNSLIGRFMPAPPDFSNKPVWGILNQYVNHAVNEMYTCLRVSPSGTVLPTLVLRQQPFTSHILATSPGLDLQVTPFLDLCRWKASPLLVQSIQLGRSDADRVNFMHLTGQGPMLVANNLPQLQLINNPPIRDELDIRRSGLKPDIAVVHCAIEEEFGGPLRWMRLRSDFLHQGHLMLQGSVQMVGIQAPICHGDNFELDGIVYHIEGVMHNASIDGSGHKSFTTTLGLSYGVNDTSAANSAPLRDDAIYYGVSGPEKLIDSHPTSES